MKYAIEARLSTTSGKGVGRWRNYYRAETAQEIVFVCRHLVPSAQVRVRVGRETVIGPCRASELPATLTESQLVADVNRYGHVAGWR